MPKDNRCVASLQKTLRKKELSWESKKRIYKTVIRPTMEVKHGRLQNEKKREYKCGKKSLKKIENSLKEEDGNRVGEKIKR